MSGDEQKIENESAIDIEQRTVNQKQDNNEKDAAQLKLREDRKRALVAEAIKSNQTFKNIQQATFQNGIKLSLDKVVDIYFKLSPDDNNLQNSNYFNISENSINMTIQNVITTVNKTENGLVLHSNGEINVKASKEQRSKMLAEQNDAEFNKQYGEQLQTSKEQDIGDNTSEQTKKLYESLQRMNSKDMAMFFESDEGKKQLKDALDNKETNENINDNRKKSNLDKKEDVIVNALQARFYQLYTSNPKDITPEMKQEMLDCIKELQKYSKGAAKKLVDPETGKITARNVKKNYEEYVKAYSEKENEDTLRRYGAIQFKLKNLDPESKREILEAALSLYMQDDKESKSSENRRNKAIIVLGSLGLLKDVQQSNLETGQSTVVKTLDMDAFKSVYNSTKNGANLTFKKIVEEVQRKNSQMALEHTEMLIDEIRNNQFKERSNESLDNRQDNESDYSDIVLKKSSNSAKEEYSDDTKNVEESKKKSKRDVKGFIEKSVSRLKTNYQKAKFYRMQQNLAKLFNGELTAEEQREMIISAYKSLSADEDFARKSEVEQAKLEGRNPDPKVGDSYTKKFLAQYMIKNPRVFGDCIDIDKNGESIINANHINKYKYLTDERRSNLRKNYNIDVGRVKSAINEAATHKKTPSLLVRGVYESTKDVFGMLARRVNYSKLGRLIEGTKLALTDGNEKYENIFETKEPAYSKNESILDEIDKSLSEGITLEESARRLKAEKGEPLEPLDVTKKEKSKGKKKIGRKKSDRDMEDINHKSRNAANDELEKSAAIANSSSKLSLKNLSELSDKVANGQNFPIRPEYLKNQFEQIPIMNNASLTSVITKSSNVNAILREQKIAIMKENCERILLEKGLAVKDDMANWPVEALIKYVVQNGGEEEIKELNEKIGFVGLGKVESPIFPKANINFNNARRGIKDDGDVR